MSMHEGEILLYCTSGGEVRMKVFNPVETFRLTQARQKELFESSRQGISYHPWSTFKSNELERAATVKGILTVQDEDGRRMPPAVHSSHLDVVIATGFDRTAQEIAAPGRRPRKRKAGK